MSKKENARQKLTRIRRAAGLAGASKAGLASAANLTAAQRSERARKAAHSRKRGAPWTSGQLRDAQRRIEKGESLTSVAASYGKDKAGLSRRLKSFTKQSG